MIKKVDAEKVLDATTIVLNKEDVKKIEEIVEAIQEYARITDKMTEEGGTAEPLLSHIRYLRSMYNFELFWDN